jgi:hypothetical protein
MYVIKRRQETYRGTDREKISTNEEDADTKKQRLEDENDRQKCRLQWKEEENVREKTGKMKIGERKGTTGVQKRKKTSQTRSERFQKEWSY